MAWRGRRVEVLELKYESQRIPEKLEKYFVLVVVVGEIVVDLQYWALLQTDSQDCQRNFAKVR